MTDHHDSLPPGWDVEIIEEAEYDGYRLFNPEGEPFTNYWVSKDLSPGRVVLLDQAVNRCLEAYRRRSILENEEGWYYKNAKRREH